MPDNPWEFQAPDSNFGSVDTGAFQINNVLPDNTPGVGGYGSFWTPPSGNGIRVDSDGSTPPVTPPPSLFNAGVARQGYNPNQYASNAGVSSVLNFLGPTASAGMTYNEGPNAGPPQAIVNWGGQNHNAGLVQNLINQFGPEVARRMMNDQTSYHQAGPEVNGTGPGQSWTLQNDPSSAGYNRQAANAIANPNAAAEWQARIAEASRLANGSGYTPPASPPNTGGMVRPPPSLVNFGSSASTQTPPEEVRRVANGNPVLSTPLGSYAQQARQEQDAAATAAGFGDVLAGNASPARIEAYMRWAEQQGYVGGIQSSGNNNRAASAPPLGQQSSAPPPQLRTQQLPGQPGQQQGFSFNDFLTLMMLLMGGGGVGGQQQSVGPRNRNPLWYSQYS